MKPLIQPKVFHLGATELARRVGLSPSHVSRVLAGQRKPGDTPAGRKLARLLAAHSVRDRAFFSAKTNGSHAICSMRRAVARVAK